MCVFPVLEKPPLFSRKEQINSVLTSMASLENVAMASVIEYIPVWGAEILYAGSTAMGSEELL